MGADIHAYIDYEEKQNDGSIYFSHFAKFNISRNYWLFSLLAGVRCENIQGQKSLTPKGLPSELSYTTQEDAYLYVVEDEETDFPGHCTKRDAEKWGSRYTDETRRWIHHPDWHSHSWVTAQELASVLRKYKKLKDKNFLFIRKNAKIPAGYTLDKQRNYPKSKSKWIYREENVEVPDEMLAIMAAMKVLDKQGKNPKFIFFFDN